MEQLFNKCQVKKAKELCTKEGKASETSPPPSFESALKFIRHHTLKMENVLLNPFHLLTLLAAPARHLLFVDLAIQLVRLLYPRTYAPPASFACFLSLLTRLLLLSGFWLSQLFPSVLVLFSPSSYSILT